MSQPARTGTQRVALVHDFLLDLRGAERVFLRLCDLSPDADPPADLQGDPLDSVD